MADELDELTNDGGESPVETPTPEPAEEPVEAKGEEEVAPPAASGPPDGYAPIAALQAERQRAQAAEGRLREIESQNFTAPNPLDDPEGALMHVRGEVSQGLWAIKSGLSRDMMMTQKDDYAARESEFLTMAEQNPALVVEMHAADNPARFAYETAEKAAKYAAIQNVDEYTAKLKADAMAEARAELAAEQAGHGAALRVGELATSRASAGSVPTSEDLGDILDGR